MQSRPSRAWRRRSHKAQVSAIATLFGLMLLVSYIASFVVTQLPNDESIIEFDHVVQVENQVSRLQSIVLALLNNPNVHYPLSTPVTLGAPGDGPLGPEESGTISTFPYTAQPGLNYSVGTAVYMPPKWGVGDFCTTPAGDGSCSSAGSGQCNPPLSLNLSANNSWLQPRISGSGNCLYLNITGSHDVVNLTITGSNFNYIDVIIAGNYNIMNLHYTGSSFGTNFYFFGQHDMYNLTTSGSSHTVNSIFVGTSNLSALCPFGNGSNTDTVNLHSTGSSNLQNLTWYNNVGYNTPYTLGSMPGGGSNNSAGYRNVSSSIGCAWTKLFTQRYYVQNFEGLRVHLNNHFTSPADVAYDHGAVILEQPGGGSTIISPPAIYSSKNAYGLFAGIVLINLVGTVPQESGATTAGLSVTLVSEQSLNLSMNTTTAFFEPPMLLNFSTPYPAAWGTWFATNPTLFSSGSTCWSPVVISAPYSCLVPPPGVSVYVRAPMAAIRVRLVVANIAISLS